MHDNTLKRFKDVTETLNTMETRFRTLHHAFLQAQGQCEESLQGYLARHAAQEAFGTPADVQTIEQAQHYAAVPFPADLVSFYRKTGSLHGGRHLNNLTIFSPESVLERTRSDSPYAHSIGLLDTIHYLWDHLREAESMDSYTAMMSQEEYDKLNRSYMAVGYWCESMDDGQEDGDMQQCIFYDRQGLFRTVFVNLLDEYFDIAQKIEHSAEACTWDEIMNHALDEALAARLTSPRL
ncbi:hypothetical protein [Saezia sanguinis]|uniref:hypothetical protein n=1 Tax=Saezia sanguinis TaxID=1965230 RepID=UPI003075980A